MNFKRFTLMTALTLLMLFALNAQVLAHDGKDISTSIIIALVENLENDGQFAAESAVRALTLHLTAVNHYEKQEGMDKVIEHMQGFKLLLHHQLENELITEIAYDALLMKTEALIQSLYPAEPDTVSVVHEGEANAVIVVPKPTEELTDHQIPGWRATFNVDKKLKVVDSYSYSGNYSLHLNDDDDRRNFGLMSDLVKIEGGKDYTAGAMAMTDSGMTTMSVMKIYYYDENKNQLEVIDNFRSVEGEWRNLSHTTTAPNEAAYISIEFFSSISGINSLYFDDVSLKDAKGENLILNNPSFEQQNILTNEADILLEYIHKTSGTVLPVVTSVPLDHEGLSLYIGHSRAEDETRHQALLLDMNEHGFIIDVQDDNITILGKTDRSTEYGVYEFLERYLGVRWLMPGPDGEHVPQHSIITVPQELIQEEPTTISRHFFGTEATRSKDHGEWSQRNRLHHNIQFHHNLSNLFDPNLFGDHPEYYYDHMVPTHPYNWQPCFNKETAAVAIDQIIDYFNENPHRTSYSLGINDSSNYCEADPDHPYFPGELNSNGVLNLSNVYYPWVNSVVEGVLEVHPDKLFGLLAYWNVYDPPTVEDLHPNVIPYITGDRMSWLDENIEGSAKQHMEAWNQAATHLGWYEYLYGWQYNVPRVYPHVTAENYQYAHENGVIAHVAEIFPNFAGEGPKPWVSAKLQWSPNQDVDDLLDDWYVSAVGEESGDYLKQHFDLWETFWTDRIFKTDWYTRWATSERRSNFMRFDQTDYLEAVAEEDIAESRSLLELVVEKAKTDEQVKRAQLFMSGFEFYEASVLSYPISHAEVPDHEEQAREMFNKVEQSYEYGKKRYELKEQFRGNPILDSPRENDMRGNWDGLQRELISALEAYIDLNPNSEIGPLLADFLAENVDPGVTALAVRTITDKETILETLDFGTGPWVDAKPIHNFLVMDTETLGPVETKAYLLWDDEYLYVGYENFDDFPQEMVISDDAPDGWWRSGADDSVETFLVNQSDDVIMAFFSNPISVKFAMEREKYSTLRPVISEVTDWEVNSNIESDRWNTVQAIPFSAINFDPNETDQLEAFLFRNYHGHSFFLGWNGGAPWSLEHLYTVQFVEEIPDEFNE